MHRCTISRIHIIYVCGSGMDRMTEGAITGDLYQMTLKTVPFHDKLAFVHSFECLLTPRDEVANTTALSRLRHCILSSTGLRRCEANVGDGDFFHLHCGVASRRGSF